MFPLGFAAWGLRLGELQQATLNSTKTSESRTAHFRNDGVGSGPTFTVLMKHDTVAQVFGSAFGSSSSVTLLDHACPRKDEALPEDPQQGNMLE